MISNTLYFPLTHPAYHSPYILLKNNWFLCHKLTVHTVKGGNRKAAERRNKWQKHVKRKNYWNNQRSNKSSV